MHQYILHYLCTAFALLSYYRPPHTPLFVFVLQLYTFCTTFVLLLFVKLYSFNINPYLKYWFTFINKIKSINKNINKNNIDNRIEDIQYQYCKQCKDSTKAVQNRIGYTTPSVVQKQLDSSAIVVQIDRFMVHSTSLYYVLMHKKAFL